jgi:hypothetical protein
LQLGACATVTIVTESAVGFDFFTIAVYERGSQSDWTAQRDCAPWKPQRCRLAEEEMPLTTQSNEAARVRAEASFRKEERTKEGAKAIMEYRANERIVREKTERLRALRSAKEAARREARRLIITTP